jgi:hypothetical protein
VQANCLDWRPVDPEIRTRKINKVHMPPLPVINNIALATGIYADIAD